MKDKLKLVTRLKKKKNSKDKQTQCKMTDQSQVRNHWENVYIIKKYSIYIFKLSATHLYFYLNSILNIYINIYVLDYIIFKHLIL